MPWKPWGYKNKAQDYDKKAAAFEICDIIVFALVLYVTLDPIMPLEEAMIRTLTKINNRIDLGYKSKEK